MDAQFWAFAEMILGAPGKAELEDACKKAGARPRGTIYAGVAPDPRSFCVSLAEGARLRGRSFARRAGHYVGSQIARHFVESTPHPNEEAHRMMQAVAPSFPLLRFIGSGEPGPHFAVEVRSNEPISPAFAEFATGFIRGAATRIREGVPALVEAGVSKDERVFTARVEWDKTGGPATGGRRRPHR
jgi:hypothetical protein